MKTQTILFVFIITLLVSCANTKNTSSTKHSKYSFTISDSSNNYNFSKRSNVTIELFGRNCYCEKIKDTFRISQSFVDSLPYDFEDNNLFLGAPKISNDLETKERINLLVIGFLDNGYFKLGIRK